MKHKIPCFYHPTMPVFVDDDEPFLETITTFLEDSYISKAFCDPYEALNYLQSYESPVLVDVNIQTIYEKVYNPHRFETIAIVVIDYTMPLNGLILCEKLCNKFFKKILLTGETDEKIAVNAFNKSLIHRYLRKDDPLLLDTLRRTIAELEQEYFAEQSEIILNPAVHADIWKKSLFCDSQFPNVFYPFYDQQKPIEYYLADPNGSFLFLDNIGKESQLVVLNELQKTDACEWQCIKSDDNAYYYNYVTSSLTNRVENKSILPYQQYLSKTVALL